MKNTLKALIILISIVVIVLIILSLHKDKTEVLREEENIGLLGNIKLSSPVFDNNSEIPKKYTCNGEDINPPLEIKDIPADTISLVLILDDKDASNFLHWLVWNINPKISLINEDSIPSNGIEGKNDFNKIGYKGPCPPSGEHRYSFRVYALDTKIGLPVNSKKEDIEKAMTGHILSWDELVGLYQKV